MSLLAVTDDLPDHHRDAYEIGVKCASDTHPAYNMAGMLYGKESEEHGGAWVMLAVPNALVRGVFAGMQEPGIELPPSKDGKLMAHISVMRPEEIDMAGGLDKITERGDTFHYNLGKLVHCNPDGWSEMSDCWFLEVHSPELQALRRSYGMSSLPKNGEFKFHITVAVRRKGVLRRNSKGKGQPAA